MPVVYRVILNYLSIYRKVSVFDVIRERPNGTATGSFEVRSK